MRKLDQRLTLQADELARSRHLLDKPHEPSALDLAATARLDSLDAALQDLKDQWLQTSQAKPAADDSTDNRLLSLESLTGTLGQQVEQLADSLSSPQIATPVPDTRLEAALQALEKDVKRQADSVKNLLLRQEDIERQSTTSHGLLADTQNAALAALPAIESRLMDAQRDHQRQLERLRASLTNLESQVARLDKLDTQTTHQNQTNWETAQSQLDDLLARFNALEASHAQAETRSQTDQQAAITRVGSLEVQITQLRDELNQSLGRIGKDLAQTLEAESQNRQALGNELTANLNRQSNGLSQTRDSLSQLRHDFEAHRQAALSHNDLAHAVEPLHAEIARALSLATEAQQQAAASTPSNPAPELTGQLDHLRGLLEKLENTFDQHQESLTRQEAAFNARIENLEHASAAQLKSLRDDLLATVETRLACVESLVFKASGTANGGSPHPSSHKSEPKPSNPALRTRLLLPVPCLILLPRGFRNQASPCRSTMPSTCFTTPTNWPLVPASHPSARPPRSPVPLRLEPTSRPVQRARPPVLHPLAKS